MKTYRVVWEIDIEAESPVKAAIEARAAQLDDDSWAVVFDVHEDDENRTHRIDLLDVLDAEQAAMDKDNK